MSPLERIILQYTGLSPDDGDAYDEVRKACEAAMKLVPAFTLDRTEPLTAEELYRKFPMNNPRTP